MNQTPSYLQQYQQLQLIQSNTAEAYKLYLVRQKQTSQYRMAKKTSIFDCSDASQDQLLNQIKILKELSNPHIIKYFDVFLEDDQFIVVLQFCEEGDLAYYAQRKQEKKESFSQKLILSWVLQILMALEYIHNKNIIHRLVSSQNIYMNHQGDLKIGSFGGAKILENTMQKAMTVVGSACNLSPQIVQGKLYDNKIDIWGLGCLIYQLANHEHPFKISSLPQLYQMIVKSPAQDLPVKYSKYLNPIYKKMMKKNPAYRPSAAQLLQQQVFIRLMKQYTKKKKIDSLGLRQVIPKQLLSHKNKTASKLPPLTNSKNLPDIKVKTPHIKKKSSQDKSSSRYKQKQPNSNAKLPSISTGRTSESQEQSTHVTPRTNHKQKQEQSLPTIPKPQKKSSPKVNSSKIKTNNDKNVEKKKQKEDQKVKEKKQDQNEDKKQDKEKQKSQEEKNKIQSVSPTTQEGKQKIDRLTLPDYMEGEYISLLCQLKLQILQKKYSPNMSQIFQQTIQFDQQ